jgi:hypothetical protein
MSICEHVIDDPGAFCASIGHLRAGAACVHMLWRKNPADGSRAVTIGERAQAALKMAVSKCLFSHISPAGPDRAGAPPCPSRCCAQAVCAVCAQLTCRVTVPAWQALAYCTSSSWSPCESDDATYDQAGVV